MLLKSLEIQGFKSFAKRTVLTFEPGITGVVGPNGSGKSNIADAIRWVLGAQSKKAVRGKVSADVIFSGTSSKPAMSLAEVSLSFDNQSHKLPYDYDEVVVTRRLYRSGDSEYLVNGSQVRLADLQHALAVAGIGAENYTVIGQGMVDRALSQSPKERRGLFEEAAGVRQFRLKRDEASRKLHETATNLRRVEDILHELEPRLKLLRRQASALEQRSAVEASLRDAYRAKFGHRYRQLVAERRTAADAQTETNREYLAIEQELQQLTKTVGGLRQSRQGLTLHRLLEQRHRLRDRRDDLTEQQSAARTAKELALATAHHLTERHREVTARLAAVQEEIPSAFKSDAALAASLQRAEHDLAVVEAEYQSLKEQLRPTNEAPRQAVVQTISELEAAIAAKRSHAELAKLVKRLKALVSGGAGQVTADTAAVLTKRDKLSDLAQQWRIKAAAEATAAKHQQTERKRYQQEADALTAQVRSIETQRTAADAEQTKQDELLGAASTKLRELDAELAKLEPQIASEQQSSLGDNQELEQAEATLLAKQQTHEAYRSELAEHNLTLAKIDTRLDDLASEAASKLGTAFPPADDETLPEAAAGSEAMISKWERKMLELGGIDQAVATEFQEVDQRFSFLSGQSEDLRQAQANLTTLIGKLERQSQKIFREAFAKINQEFRRYFATLFGGGKAELLLIEQAGESGEAVEFGIDIKAVPPGKRMQGLAMLSGGERALTSVALLFAILTVNPSPFVMLDEVDAALDEANTARFAELLSQLSAQTQFVVVTHNRDTMRAAQRLYGVTMDDSGISTMLSIKLPEADQIASSA